MKEISFKQLLALNINGHLTIETPAGYPFLAKSGNYARFIHEINFLDFRYEGGIKKITFNYANDFGGYTTLYYPREKHFDSAETYKISPRTLLIVIFKGTIRLN